MQNTQPALRTPRPVTPSSIVAGKLQDLQALALDLGYTDPDFTQQMNDAAALSTGMEAYLATCTTPESDALAEIARATGSEDWNGKFVDGGTALALEQEMLSGHLEGQLLKMFIHMTRATRVLEIGLFTGYSALAMAEALPPDGVLVACEVDTYAANFAQRHFAKSPHGYKIRVEIDPAMDTLARLAVEKESFDFIFIDADKGSYWSYLDTLLAADLLAENGLVCVDNTLMQGQPYLAGEPTENGRAIADFNRRVASDPRVEQVMLPVRDGVTLIRRV